MQQRIAKAVVVVGLAPCERVQQRTAETVAVVGLAPRGRVQQQTVDAPRPQDKNVLPKRVSERISDQSGAIKVPEIAFQDRRLLRAVEQYLDVSVEEDTNVFLEQISERMQDKLSREHLKLGFQLWRCWMILCLLKICEAEKGC